MKGQILSMSMKERERLKVFSRVEAGELKLVEAAGVLGMSYRQSQRMMARYKEEGDGGIVHRSRGRPSNRGVGKERREAVLGRYSERYGDFGPTLAAEKLLVEGFDVDHETLRRWLIEAGLWKVWAEKIEAPELAGEEEVFRGDGADGRVDTRLVRRTERGLLPDEYGGRCDGDKAVPVRGRRNDRRSNEAALGMDREIRYSEGAVHGQKERVCAG